MPVFAWSLAVSCSGSRSCGRCCRARRPALVFADEATSRLDLVTQEQTVDALMSEIVESGAALLLVTHDTDLSAAVADREIVL